jgi:uncharacterized membrane protein
MACPFCGAVFGVAINYGAGVMARSLANHIRRQHPQAAFVVAAIGATVIAAVLYWLAQLLLH